MAAGRLPPSHRLGYGCASSCIKLSPSQLRARQPPGEAPFRVAAGALPPDACLYLDEVTAVTLSGLTGPSPSISERVHLGGGQAEPCHMPATAARRAAAPSVPWWPARHHLCCCLGVALSATARAGMYQPATAQFAEHFATEVCSNQIRRPRCCKLAEQGGLVPDNMLP